MVYHLHKCLYSFKQASRVWNRHFNAFLRKFSLIPSESHPCLYHRHHKEEFTMVIIWVDHCLACSNSNKEISDIINYLADHFEMRSSEANRFVGLSIFRNRKQKTLYLSQPECTEKILQPFHMDGCHPVSLPATHGAFLNKEENIKKTIQVPFKEATGSLMYLMLSSRPDIAFALNQASQFCETHKQHTGQPLRNSSHIYKAQKTTVCAMIPQWSLLLVTRIQIMLETSTPDNQLQVSSVF